MVQVIFLHTYIQRVALVFRYFTSTPAPTYNYQYEKAIHNMATKLICVYFIRSISCNQYYYIESVSRLCFTCLQIMWVFNSNNMLLLNWEHHYYSVGNSYKVLFCLMCGKYMFTIQVYYVAKLRSMKLRGSLICVKKIGLLNRFIMWLNQSP